MPGQAPSVEATYRSYRHLQVDYVTFGPTLRHDDVVVDAIATTNGHGAGPGVRQPSVGAVSTTRIIAVDRVSRPAFRTDALNIAASSYLGVPDNKKAVEHDVGVEMQVDPQVLRALAGQADGVVGVIKTADVGTKAVAAADGLPGSTTQWAAHTVGDHFTQQARKLADDVTKMGQAVRGAGDKFEVADDTLAKSFDGLF